MTTSSRIDIIPFEDRHAADFDRLNRTWLAACGLLEPLDEPYLTAPRRMILDPGGAIFLAVQDDTVIGTAAAIPAGTDAVELVKVGVVPTARSSGTGRRLVCAVIAHARQRGMARVVLTSNSGLTAALSLYRSLGFVDHPCPPDVGYVTADVYMELALDGPTGA
ncbi:MAG: GNAT family N-acetyltransferase [Gemmatimonadaceae bacterium]|nr:GNAT family N-acetyltransferase [Gemmatimonadaceae bacterium]